MLVALAMFAGCGGGPDESAGGGTAADRVTATVTYRERTALPPNARITVQLADVSRADAPAVVLGEQIFEAGGGQVPFSVVIPYDQAAIAANRTYAIQARIEVEGALRFISDRHYAVLTRGAPAHVEIMLKAVGDR